jgi:hypothetical protein
MKQGMRLAGLATCGVAAIAFASPAYAQATRTWVSGVGDDVNPCSRTAPCKTFAGAISKTAVGGEINCLDPGGFGTLTITKSITIDCTGTFGSTLNSGGINGFTINDSLAVAPGTSEVRLRGLSINGAGTTPGLNGIRFIRGKSLVVEDVFIQNQKSGSGISIAPSAGTVKIEIHDVTVVDSGTATTAGIEMKPTGTGAIQFAIRNTDVSNNTGNGLRLDSTTTTGAGVLGMVENSQFSGSGQGVAVVAGAGPTTLSTLTMIESQVFNNTNFGIIANGAGARARITSTLITANGTGVSPAGGSFVNDLGSNALIGNTTNGAFN